MKRLLIALLALSLSACVLFPRASVHTDTTIDALVGFYAVAGTNPDGTSYHFEAVVEKVDFGAAIVTYLDNGASVAGCGMVRDESHIAVGCVPPSVMLLRVEGATLVGQWFGANAQGFGTEIWTRLEALTPPSPDALEHVHPVPTPGVRL